MLTRCSASLRASRSTRWLSEYCALRAVVITRWTSQLGEVASSHLDEPVRFGECVDQAVAESLSVHLEQLEQSRNLLLGVLGRDATSAMPVRRIQRSACASRMKSSWPTMAR